MNKGKILITGGSGLLGSHVASLLLKKGYSVLVVDKRRPLNPDVDFINSDFNNQDVMIRILRKVDGVFHFAAFLGVDACRLNPEEVKRVNYRDTKDFIDLCIKCRIKRFIFSSSSEVYGNSPNIPYQEEASLTPISVYGQTKVLIEQHLKQIQKDAKMTVGIVRLFNVYGPGQNKHFIIPIFIDNALKHRPLIIHGDGLQIRCFTYVEDCAEGIIKLFEYNKSPFEIFNIGRNYEYTMNDVSKIILKLIPNSKSKIEHIPYGTNGVRTINSEIRRRVPSVEKAKNILKFQAAIPLEEGIRKMLKTMNV